MQFNTPYHNDTVALSVTKLRQRYRMTLSLIAFLIITSQITMLFILTTQTHDAHIVNIAGRQRMLSQKITKLSYYISTNDAGNLTSSYQTELKYAIDLWEDSHLGLINGSKALALPGNNSQEVLVLFDKIKQHHDKILNAARIINSSFDLKEIKQNTYYISQHEAAFLEGMNEIVFQYDREANTKIINAKWLEFILMFLKLIALFLCTIFIFSPAAQSIQRNMQILIKRDQDLRNLFAASPTAMLLIDPKDLSILLANEKAQTLVGESFDTNSKITLPSYLSSDYKCNQLFIEQLKKSQYINEVEITICNTKANLFETLASIRVVNFDRKEVLVVGLTNISEFKKAQQQLEHYASYDEMTGLLNRRTGLLFLKKSMQLLQRNKDQLSLCYIDIDGLKNVNDHYGHAQGDWLINAVSQALTDTIRTSDAAVRLGGDEFLLIFHNCSINDTKQLVSKIKNRLKKKETEEHKPFPVEFSYGITLYTGDSALSPDELISEADNLMYQSKRLKKSKAQEPQ